MTLGDKDVLLIAGLDVETTGFLEAEHRIIEACVMQFEYDCRTKVRRLVKTYTQRINPGRSIDSKASAVHKITEADLIGKPSFKDVAPDLCAILDECDLVVAHNGMDFDFPFLVQELERVRHTVPDFSMFDTMLNGRWATSLGNVPSLGALAWACGVSYDYSAAHAAEYDVQTMMDCFFYGLSRGVYTLEQAV